MLAIATALVVTPDYLLIDELSLGLAPVIVRRLVPVVRAVAARGVGVLLVEQFAAVALDIATHVAVMKRGEIGFTRSPRSSSMTPACSGVRISRGEESLLRRATRQLRRARSTLAVRDRCRRHRCGVSILGFGVQRSPASTRPTRSTPWHPQQREITPATTPPPRPVS